jgi:adenosine deaminase
VTDRIEALPKAVLHDHLDGGLRPGTVVELAAAAGHALPAAEPEALGEWFVEAASAGSLERYLETFEHTVAVMQRPDHLARVAREAVQDLAADGVVYAELRYAPEQHQRDGLTLIQVIDSVRVGVEEGTQEAARRGRRIRVGVILTAMRHADRSEEIARQALAHRDRGVVGFDIAGAEAGHGAARHARAFQALREASFPFTIHAGEAAGLPSIWEAVAKAGALRLGHGVRIVEDIAGLGAAGSPAGPWGQEASGGEGVEFAELGHLANWIRDWRICLELAPSSNVQTGAAQSIAAHPITALKRLGFEVTLNTDNRLMSGTSMTHEATALMAEAGWTVRDLRDVTVAALRNAFIHADERDAIIADQILPAYPASA